jgi:Domain of unknown function (DUF4390)
MRCARGLNWAYQPAALAACVVALCAFAGLAFAQSSQAFGVRTAYAQLVDGVYLLNARLHLPLNGRMRGAINDGVPLTLELQIEVSGARRYWMDETVASLTQRYELQFHAVSNRYLVRNLNSGEQTSFATLDAAVEQLTRISGLPVLDQALVGPDRRHEFSMRATFELGDMPAALRILMFWADDVHRTSEWYTWPLLQ